MEDEYFKRLLFTASAENHKVIIDLAFVNDSDPKLKAQLDKVINALHKSNALMTKLAKSKIILTRDQ